MRNIVDADTYENFLRELNEEVISRARQAKKEYGDTSNDPEKRSIAWGTLLALYGVLTLIKQQAEGFNIPESKIGLKGIDPDRELL